MYLYRGRDAHAVRSGRGFIPQSAPRSCSTTSTLTSSSNYGKEWVPYATKVGEEPRWGIPAGETGAMLATRGLNLASDIGADELMVRYLRRADGSTLVRPFEFGAVAHAFVAG